MNKKIFLHLSAQVLLASLFISQAWGQNATSPSTATAPFPTLSSISLNWPISGDDNEDGEVSVRFREQGQQAWEDGLPLRRIPAGSTSGFSWENKFSGSLFSLKPGTNYEVELTLADPDGGSESQTLNVQTRPIPTPPAGLEVVEVTPATLNAELGNLAPGKILELAPGEYGELTISNSGTAGQPIIVRAKDEKTAIVNGDVRMDGESHVWLHGLHVKGKIKFNDAKEIVIERMLVETSGDGIISFGPGVENAYVADNIIRGSTVWAESSLGVSGNNEGEGIALTGPGNVMAYNRVSGFRDCVSLLEGDAAVRQFSIDIIGNDLNICADDAIEADFTMGNVRVIGNQMNNSFIAMSSQPSLGGPTYFIRNVAFNTIYQVFKPQRTSVGDIWLHNTSVKGGDAMGVYTDETWSRAWFRNNLLIGGPSGTYNGYSNGSGRVFNIRSLDNGSSDFDYDGLGMVNVNGFEGRIGDVSFSSFADLVGNSGQEANAIQVDLSVFENAPTFPNNPFPEHAMPDLSLGQGVGIDGGEVLANINSDFSGAAPDLGAIEFGTIPQYGPREDPVCGNSIKEVGEECDDGNDISNDGCTDCMRDPTNPGDMGSGADMSSDMGGKGEDMNQDDATNSNEDAGPTDGDSGSSKESDAGTNGPRLVEGTSGCGCSTTSNFPATPFLLFFALIFLGRSRKGFCK